MMTTNVSARVAERITVKKGSTIENTVDTNRNVHQNIINPISITATETATIGRHTCTANSVNVNLISATDNATNNRKNTDTTGMKVPVDKVINLVRNMQN